MRNGESDSVDAKNGKDGKSELNYVPHRRQVPW